MKKMSNTIAQPIFLMIFLGQSIFLCVSCSSKNASQDTLKTAYIHRYGVEVPDEADWSSRGGTGEVIKTQKNGVVIREMYVKGSLDGISTWTFPHREIVQRVAHFKEGELLEETLNYISGTPDVKNVYSQGKLVNVSSWYEDGSPRIYEEYKEDLLETGKYFTLNHDIEATVKDASGCRVVRDGLGALIARENIVGGKLEQQITYHANGVPSAMIPYVNGKVHGFKKIFYNGGEPRRIEEWKDGVLDGQVSVYENGERVATVPYKNGQKEGIELRFKDGSNVIVEEISWSADKKNGPSVVSIAGQKVTEWYYEDERVSKVQYLECVSPSYLSKD